MSGALCSVVLCSVLVDSGAARTLLVVLPAAALVFERHSTNISSLRETLQQVRLRPLHVRIFSLHIAPTDSSRMLEWICRA